MTKMKKLFAVVLALAMLFTMASFSASAENTATVRMNVLSESGKLVVKISADENVGGLTATLNYDKALVKYVGCASSNDANQEVNTLKDDGNGKVSIVLLGNKLDVKFEAIGAAGAISFTLDNIKASNADGTALLDTAEEVVATKIAVTTDGNTIRNTEIVEKQDLGFVSTFIGSAVPEGAEEIQLGFIALPTAMLGEAELEIGNYDNALVSIVDIPDRDTLVAEGATGYIAHITGFLQGNETDGYDYSRMGRKISGRFFVKYTLNGSEKCFYSNNDADSPTVEAGVVSKSFVGTCKAMTTAIMNSGMAYNYTTELGSDEAIQDILDATKTDNTQKANILNFVIVNATILEQLDAQ